jgi:toxin ParE1/3/4
MGGHRSLIWSPAAEQDLLDIWRYFARVASPEIADALLHEIESAADRLRENPLLGRQRLDIAPSLVGDLRAVRADPYSIFYRPPGTAIQIIRVLHERQDIPTILGEEHR